MGPAGWAVFISTVLVLLASCIWWSVQQPSVVPAPIAAAKPIKQGQAQPYIDTPAQADPSLKPRSPTAKPPASPSDGVKAEAADEAAAGAEVAEDKAAPAAVPQDPLQRAHARADAARKARKLEEQETAAKAQKEQHTEPSN